MLGVEIDEWTLDGVLDELAGIHQSMQDRQFAFILGAGASFSSGIPTGKTLAENWLREMHRRECRDGSDIDTWVQTLGIEGLTLQTAAEHYPRVFERRFRRDREAGYAALELAMEGKSPSLGYSLLAEIIQNTRHKVVVTTNFDNLVADALAMHAHQSPLVVAHESLAGFVRPQLRRPLVAKIHRDLFLNPQNDQVGVSTLDAAWTAALRKLFQYFTPVFVGYGGNDGSLMGLLESLKPGEIAGRMIWCYRDEPPNQHALKILEQHSGIQVKIPGFDDFMLRLAAKLVKDFDVAAIADRIERLGKQRSQRYRDQSEDLQKNSSAGSAEQQKSGQILQASAEPGKTWWAWELKAQAEKNDDKRDAIYREGLTLFPKSAELANNYANFLKYQRKDYSAAEAFYKIALELDPNDAEITGNYANFLADQRKDFDTAEALYKRALELDPTDANSTANFAALLLGKADELSIQKTGVLVRRVVALSAESPNQALAEALLYGCLCSELTQQVPGNNMNRLKELLGMNFARESWDFSPVFAEVLPKISPDRKSLYEALGDAILNPDKVGALDAFPLWRDTLPADPFAPY